jgi:glycyl-tRNA synthetase beta chain
MTVAVNNLLVELFVEELPPKALRMLGEAFGDVVYHALAKRDFIDARTDEQPGLRQPWQPFASPRRLAVWVSDVRARAADSVQQLKLMPAAVGLDAEGRPSPALLKKLAALGTDASALPRLQRRSDGKAEVLYLETAVPGVTLAAGLQQALDEAIAKLPIPKLMSYQLADGWTSVQFVRPAHGLVALHGSAVVPVAALGLRAGRTTRGHRFEAAVEPIVLRDADSYEQQLADEGAVIAGFDERRREIEHQLRVAAAREGLQFAADDALLDEVCALVERPNVLVGRFDPAFLEVPQECLILTMKANQKYFPLLDAQGRLAERFLIVANVRPADPARVIEGNERVVRPRLADAKFFYDQDRKRTLESRVPGLARVVYHARLGTMGERVARVAALAEAIGERLGGAALAQAAARAAQLAKADLLTDMVGEFPELQGVMGGYYARHDGEDEAVAQAIEDQYRPRFAGDALPRGETGLALALADKLETLAGLFGVGQLPSGDKDPYALRRHALGIVRMLVERALPLDVHELVARAFAVFPPTHGQAQAEVAYFLRERLAGWLREQGWSAAEVDAVLGVEPRLWAELPRRLAAVRAFAALPQAPALAAANKRVGNILKKTDGASAGAVDAALLREPAERALAAAVAQVCPQADRLYDAGAYTDALAALAALREPVDVFFDQVLVNAEDPALRANRLALLAGLHRAMNRVAELARLAA